MEIPYPLPTWWGRRGPAWERMKVQVFTEETHCWWCGEFVDQTLHHNDRWSRTVDHLEQIEVRPDLAYDRANCRLAHRSCNSTRGNIQKQTAQGVRPPGQDVPIPRFRTTQPW